MELKHSLPKISLIRIRKVFLAFLVIFVSFGVGYLLGFGDSKKKAQLYPKVEIERSIPNGKPMSFSLFWRVWDTLELKYFDKEKLIPSEMVYGAIEGMVAALGDPYTAFLPPKQNQVVQDDLKGNFSGVGINIGFIGTQLAVIAPLVGTPAEEVGIKAGDFIVGIKDEAKGVDIGTFGMSLPEAVQLIRGPEGSRVTLALLRNGSEEPIIVDVIRKTIDVPSVEFSFIEGNESVVHVKLLKFGGETKEEWDEAVAEVLKNEKIKSIIIDLRNNTGGYLQAAVEIASDFVKADEVVVIQENSDGTKEKFESKGIPRLANYQIILLVNKGSASASEILAGALRDLKKIKVVGSVTFGKGSIQEPIQLEDGSGLHVTTARWLTPSGYWVDGKGLEPDVTLENDPKTIKDEQLLKAIELISQ